MAALADTTRPGNIVQVLEDYWRSSSTSEMESKPQPDATALHHEGEKLNENDEVHNHHHATVAHGIVEAAALFQGMFPYSTNATIADCLLDDGTGNLSSKLLLPRPTEDPRDPLVCHRALQLRSGLKFTDASRPGECGENILLSQRYASLCSCPTIPQPPFHQYCWPL